MLSIPASTLSPALTVRGTLSPVSTDVSNDDFSLSIVPSSGTLSPTFTRMTSPTDTSCGEVSTKIPLRRTQAVSGRTSSNALILPVALRTAIS